jgi:hypothetical protein
MGWDHGGTTPFMRGGKFSLPLGYPKNIYVPKWLG